MASMNLGCYLLLINVIRKGSRLILPRVSRAGRNFNSSPPLLRWRNQLFSRYRLIISMYTVAARWRVMWSLARRAIVPVVSDTASGGCPSRHLSAPVTPGTVATDTYACATCRGRCARARHREIYDAPSVRGATRGDRSGAVVGDSSPRPLSPVDVCHVCGRCPPGRVSIMWPPSQQPAVSGFRAYNAHLHNAKNCRCDWIDTFRCALNIARRKTVNKYCNNM